jgi:hypothetical protein
VDDSDNDDEHEHDSTFWGNNNLTTELSYHDEVGEDAHYSIVALTCHRSREDCIVVAGRGKFVEHRRRRRMGRIAPERW